METALFYPVLLGGMVTFYFGLLSLLYLPMACAYPFWERRLIRRAIAQGDTPRVSVLVPAYNEERTIALSIASILASDYARFEVIVIDDGSRDGTRAALQPYIDAGRIRYIAKPNGGKASALNLGLTHATGDIVLFTDADTVFEPHTIRNGVRYFADPAIGAVGGNDTPLHPRGLLQKMLVVTSHIGTGFVRRAVSLMRVLPIIPGNLGLVRADLLRDIGGFREGWGEDLELTLRLHRHGIRVVYGASARVLAECPDTLKGLWRQRVRWLRSYIKVVRLHRDMLGNPRFGPFGIYLALNSVNIVVIPVLQMIAIVLLPLMLAAGVISIAGFEWIVYLGLGSLLSIATIAILLDKTPRDLFYLPYLAVLIPLSHFYNAVVLFSIWAEIRTRSEDWNKLERRDIGNLPPIDIDRERRRLVLGSAAIATVGAGGFAVSTGIEDALRMPIVKAADGFKITVSLHFSDWNDWRKALSAVIDADESRFVDVVAVSAGRPDWTFFRWDGHERWWAAPQRVSSASILETAIAQLKKRGHETSAMMDVFAPRYLALNPAYAARDDRGRPSKDIVCSTWLAEGEYGTMLVNSCEALARHTAADSVCITEMFYDDHCFDRRCRDAFCRKTGYKDWPRDASGAIARTHPAIGEWRSKQVAGVTRRVSRAVRQHGKRLLFDVKLSRQNLSDNSMENGQDYKLLIPEVDQLIVWDYFGLENLSPSASMKIAQYMTDTFGAAHYWHSIGLWDTGNKTLSADEMFKGSIAARRGGARNIWITPGRRLTSAHWRAIAMLKGRGNA